MKAFIRAVDRFCAKHPRFGIGNLMLYIVIGNAIVYLASMMDSSGLFATYLALYPAGILRGEVWRLVTFVFVPDAGNIIYLALFMYFTISSAGRSSASGGAGSSSFIILPACS